MKNVKSEKGAITILVLVSVLFIVSFLISAYVIIANKVQAQKEIVARTKAIYEQKATMEQIYNSYFQIEGEVVPIYEVEQLLAIGTNKKVNINGKIYYFNDDSSYILMNDLTFNASDWESVLGENKDWMPIGDNAEFNGTFYGNGRTITVTKIGGTTEIYSEENEYSEIAYLTKYYKFSYNTINKTATITGLSDEAKTLLADNVVKLGMPDTVIEPNSKTKCTITSIANNAFYAIENQGGIECANLDLYNLPNGLTSIGNFAFRSCKNLTLTELPDSITSINGYAFAQCTNLALEKLPSELNVINPGVFQMCSNLRITELPANITSIGNYAFHGCSNIEITELPDDITSIGKYAFYSCAKMSISKLPSNLKKIEDNIFIGCSNMVLTSIPDGITSIGIKAFQGCEKINISELPSSLNIIESYAFQNCRGIVSINIDSTIQTIGKSAFSGCTNLKTINYNGTMDEWNLVSIGTNAIPTGTQIICLDGTITI